MHDPKSIQYKEKEPMLKLFNNIKSKLDYCCIVGSPVNQKWIYVLEKIQKKLYQENKCNGKT